MELFVLDADYEIENNRGVALLYCRDSNGKSILLKDSNFTSYFYAIAKNGKENALKKKIEKIETKKIETKIPKVEIIEKTFMGERVKAVKIFVENPRRIKDVREVVKRFKETEQTYEYDLTHYRRYLIDKKIEPMNWIEIEGEETKDVGRFVVDKVINAKSVKTFYSEKNPNFNVLAFDTEWIEERGQSKLIMLSMVSKKIKKVITYRGWKGKPSFVEIVKDEKAIIERFMEILKKDDVDVIVGYNSDGFDFPALKNRSFQLKVSLKAGRDDSPVFVVQRGRISSAKSRGRVHIDLYDFIEHILSPSMKSEVLTLDEVSKELLGLAKKDMKYKDITEIWTKKGDMDRLAEYSLWDSELTFKLSELIIPQIDAICELTGLLPFDVTRFTYSQLVESFFMRKAFADNVLIPNRPHTEDIEGRREEPAYKGAIVIEPKRGIHSDILVFDFRSLYPSIIVAHNIDPATFNQKGCKKKTKVPEYNWFFCQDQRGFIPKHLEEVLRLRVEVKEKLKKSKKGSVEHQKLENMQYALKIIANASYGYFGFFGARWYKREAGASAAAFGRHYISLVIKEAKKAGFEIIYGDTDSLMIRKSKEKTKNKILEMGRKFEQSLNKKLPGIMELEFRELYEGGIFVATEKEGKGAKKRYALIDYDGNIEIRGFETVRRDWCELSKRIQREVLVTILKDRNPAKAVQIVRDTIKKINDGKVPLEDLTILEQITRPISQYQAIGPHVKAAMKSIEKGRPIGEGTVIAFVITKGKGSISERAEPVEDVKQNQYDPEYYVNNQVLPAAMRVLKALGYEEKEVLEGTIQKKLEAWMKK